MAGEIEENNPEQICRNKHKQEQLPNNIMLGSGKEQSLSNYSTA